MPTTEEIREAIAKSAEEGIDSTLIDGMSIREKSLDERISALKELQKSEAQGSNTLPIRVGKFISQGLD
jgi:hypothetical protein